MYMGTFTIIGSVTYIPISTQCIVLEIYTLMSSCIVRTDEMRKDVDNGTEGQKKDRPGHPARTMGTRTYTADDDDHRDGREVIGIGNEGTL